MQWEEITRKAYTLGTTPEFVFREETQKAVLSFLSRKSFFREGVFQGGTALRLFYGAPRFSEDLDFVFVAKNSGTWQNTGRLLQGLEAYLLGVFPFPLEVTAKKQKESETLKRFSLRATGGPLSRKVVVNIEFANVPSYMHRVAHLEFPPFNPMIRVEAPEEILADKVVACALRAYIKGRDLWDIRYLTLEKGLILPVKLVAQKARDYGSTARELAEKLKKAAEKVREEGRESILNEMPRFLAKHEAELLPAQASEAAIGVASLLEEAAKKVAFHADDGVVPPFPGEQL
ncbi:Domain of unknown function DUF1814 (plasmid) [Ammonifex degensii KC4]|uniref:Nucleotidyl transferase AbiEii/AbiGii toxin family protein n=1 Tax=Ammonifex degensii (strain DSM 10501 / KC4) TaxID=429009 RepID=C9RDI2_AMMDK|nr:nucleotidyl transferase AbiEii/AbiGii toxin family protein [Ammonifex degensii]ACX53253.1 Domain of unknown function DUF1814 [Ammonifex degensii KC4]